MSDPSAILVTKIAELERERSQALARAQDHLRKHDELTARASEIDVVLKHVRQWAAEQDAIQPPDRVATANLVAGKLPIRKAVHAFLALTPAFRGGELVRAVQNASPESLARSIRAELSHCTRRGEAKRIAQDQYVSLIAPDANGAQPTMEDSDGPRAGFGRVSA